MYNYQKNYKFMWLLVSDQQASHCYLHKTFTKKYVQSFFAQWHAIASVYNGRMIQNNWIYYDIRHKHDDFARSDA